MASCWSSNDSEVLAWWADLEKRNKAYDKACRKVEKEFPGRHVVIRTGFGDPSPMGISTTSYSEDPPPGWKLGWGKRGSGFFEPRHTPNKDHPREACEHAEQVIKGLHDVHVKPRREAHQRFGVPEFQYFGLVACTPGLVLLDDVLWLTFGSHDYEPPRPTASSDHPHIAAWFNPRLRSEFYAACEAAGYNPEADDAA